MGLTASPDEYFESVFAVQPDGLLERGLRAALVDIDNTLLPRDAADATDEARAWVARARDAGLRVCLVSNNWHARVQTVGDQLELPVVSRAIKPFPRAFRKAAEKIGVEPQECAVIGDQVFTDIVGGNLVGATTILVRPLSSSDLPHTRLLRTLEGRIMAGREPVA